jgi:sugar/nucleoside kinase (ribokinase family)
MASLVELDYLVIGHVTRDLVDGAFTIGGTASYSARAARAMGCRVGVVTSASAGLDLSQVLDGILVARFPAAETTTFENIYTSDGRRQMVHDVAETLVPEMIPPNWRATIIHLGPVARECDPALVDAFGDAFVGMTPQGWMRRWDQAGHVSYVQWEEAEALLARADAVVLSEEDVAGDESLLARYAAQTRTLVVTQGASGCTVYTADQSRHCPAVAVQAVNATGAGDIFATAFFIWLQRSSNPWTAARFANCVAARSVVRKGLSSTPSPAEIAHCRRVTEGQGKAE